jgi:hypothetical protein
MTTATQFLQTAPALGPSRHKEMPLPVRIALYRRVLGYMRFSDKDQSTLSYRAQVELKSSVFESMLITGVMVERAPEQMRLLSIILEDALAERAVSEQVDRSKKI